MDKKGKNLMVFNNIKSVYWDWHIGHIGYKPVFDKTDGAGLQKLSIYLLSLSDDNSVDGAVNIFKHIIAHWDELSEYYKGQTRMRQINSNIHNIIYFFKNGRDTKNKTGVSSEYLQRLVNDMRE